MASQSIHLACNLKFVASVPLSRRNSNAFPCSKSFGFTDSVKVNRSCQIAKVQAAESEPSVSTISQDTATPESELKSLPEGACKSCGKESVVGGCNGEGRIQGGLGAVPGFGWWPIKAYRPCPEFLKAGGRYRRKGQSLDEVAFGRKGKDDDIDISERLQGGK